MLLDLKLLLYNGAMVLAPFAFGPYHVIEVSSQLLSSKENKRWLTKVESFVFSGGLQLIKEEAVL